MSSAIRPRSCKISILTYGRSDFGHSTSRIVTLRLERAIPHARRAQALLEASAGRQVPRALRVSRHRLIAVHRRGRSWPAGVTRRPQPVEFYAGRGAAASGRERNARRDGVSDRRLLERTGCEQFMLPPAKIRDTLAPCATSAAGGRCNCPRRSCRHGAHFATLAFLISCRMRASALRQIVAVCLKP